MESRHDATPPRRQKQFEPPSELDALAERVLDAAFEVHRDIGPGFGEHCYEAAMAIELGCAASLSFVSPSSSCATRAMTSARAAWICW